MQRISKWLKALYQYRNLIRHLVQRDLKIKYRRSFLGYLWSILNPLMIMLILSVVFSFLFRRNIENFPVYVITGQVMFNYMVNSTNQGMRSILSNAALIKKIYVPKYIFTLAKVTSSLVDFVLSLGALALVMLFTGLMPTWYILVTPLVILQLYLFCLGLSLFLAQATVFFRDIQYIYSVVTTAWMYLTPMFYPVEILPENIRYWVQAANPMYLFITQFRSIILHGEMPLQHLMLKGYAIAIVTLVIGVLSFLRSQKRFILYI